MALFARLLVAQQAFIEELSAQVITMRQGGVIQSEGFDGAVGNVPGFRLTAENGLLEAVAAVLKNINILGDSWFAGGINAGPLIANNNLTGQTSSPTVFTSDATARDINIFFGRGDSFSSTWITDFKSITSGSFGSRGGLVGIVMQSKGTGVGFSTYRHHKTQLNFAEGAAVELEWFDYDGYRNTIGQALTIGGGMPGKTLIITQVPQGDEGLQPGTLYTDLGDNVLRIKR